MDKRALLFQKRVVTKRVVVRADRSAELPGFVPVAPSAPVRKNAIALGDMAFFLLSWEANGQYKGLAKTTLDNRRLIVEKLIWWMNHVDHSRQFGKAEMIRWIAYIRPAHNSAGDVGRWGNEEKVKAARPSTVATYFDIIRAWCNFLVKEKHLDESPLETLDRPNVPVDHVKPFQDEHVVRLREAAGKSPFKVRDMAIVDLLTETALRVSELVALRRCDIDLDLHLISIENGKGGKSRQVPFGLEVKQSLARLITAERPGWSDHLFQSARGKGSYRPMTRSGIGQVFERLNRDAKIEGVRVSPHTGRHYGATSLIANGADQYTVMNVLGHTSIKMTAKYVSQSSHQIADKVRRFSPLDNLRKKTRGQGRRLR